jgi:uncharacterized protein YbbK (DUF523 family)
MILVSACLVGVNCRYDGSNNIQPELVKKLATGCFLPVCPEQLGGLPTPRIPAEILGGTGEDLLKSYDLSLDAVETTNKLDGGIGPLGFCEDTFQSSSTQVINQAGKNLTTQFLRGALEVVRLARSTGVRYAILKASSPSCGCGLIYDGSFNRCLINGDGVTTALLKKIGIKVLTEEQVTPELLDKLISK